MPWRSSGLIRPWSIPCASWLASRRIDRCPPTARVAACKALLAARDQDPAEASAVVGDAISVRAQELLAARRKAN